MSAEKVGFQDALQNFINANKAIANRKTAISAKKPSGFWQACCVQTALAHSGIQVAFLR